MAKKIKKFPRDASPRRGGEKYRRAGRSFTKAVICYILLVMISAIIGVSGSCGLEKESVNGFAICFLWLPAYLPLLVIDGIASCCSCSVLEPGKEVTILAACDIIIALAVWLIVRLAAYKKQSSQMLRTARIFVLIMVVWGVFQLFCCAAAFAREKSSFFPVSNCEEVTAAADHK